MNTEIKIVGQMEGYESANRVYGVDGVSPCIKGRDYKDPPKILILDDTYGYEDEPRIYKDVIPALRSSRGGLKVIVEDGSGTDWQHIKQ